MPIPIQAILVATITDVDSLSSNVKEKITAAIIIKPNVVKYAAGILSDIQPPNGADIPPTRGVSIKSIPQVLASLPSMSLTKNGSIKKLMNVAKDIRYAEVNAGVSVLSLSSDA